MMYLVLNAVDWDKTDNHLGWFHTHVIRFRKFQNWKLLVRMENKQSMVRTEKEVTQKIWKERTWHIEQRYIWYFLQDICCFACELCSSQLQLIHVSGITTTFFNTFVIDTFVFSESKTFVRSARCFLAKITTIKTYLPTIQMARLNSMKWLNYIMHDNRAVQYTDKWLTISPCEIFHEQLSLSRQNFVKIVQNHYKNGVCTRLENMFTPGPRLSEFRRVARPWSVRTCSSPLIWSREWRPTTATLKHRWTRKSISI